MRPPRTRGAFIFTTQGTPMKLRILVLATATLRRRNWARLLLCLDSVVSVAGVILPRLWTDSSGLLHGGLLPVAISVICASAFSAST